MSFKATIIKVKIEGTYAIHRRNLTIGGIYPSKHCGDMKVLREVSPEESGNYNTTFYEIEFLDTGTSKLAGGDAIKKGTVRDPFARSVCGIGYTGNINVNYPGTRKTTREYNTWRLMITRCYNSKSSEYKTYGAKGVTVCDRWQCYEYFYYDFTKMPNYDKWLAEPGKWQLDKDIKQQDVPDHMKVYSPETCCIIHIRDNAREMFSRKYADRELPFGVYDRHMKNGSYTVIASRPGDHKHIHLGTFNNMYAAGQYYDMYCKYVLRDTQYLNGYNDMTVGEVMAHWYRAPYLRTMCKVVDNSQPYTREMCRIVDNTQLREICHIVKKHPTHDLINTTYSGNEYTI